MTKELTIEELQERWELLPFLGIERVKIIEQFPIRGVLSYEASGLSMELEDEFAVCCDHDDNIIKNLSVLMMFLQKSLSKALLIPIGNGLYQERLEFENDGIIIIEKA